jgi:iron complex outermembrane recepter protein
MKLAHLSILCLPGLCQSAGVEADEPTELAQVTVTAQKREQNIQDVPIAITAFSAQDLSTRAITDLHGLSHLIPGVNLDAGSITSGSSSVLAASVRGIGQDDFAFNLDPSVGVYQDGVYLARTVGANLNLLDVDHVEVLKGPQGTLFGRNSIGGAINIVTRQPAKEFSLQGTASTGSFNRRDVSLEMDLPMSEHLLSSVTVSSLYRDGYQRRIPLPPGNSYVTDPTNGFVNSGYETFDVQGGQNEQVVRVKLLWQVTDSLTATVTGDWTHTNQPATAVTVLQTIDSPPDAVFNVFYNDCLLGIAFAPNAAQACGPRANAGTSLWQANLNPNTARPLFGPQIVFTGNIDRSYATGPDFDKLDAFGASATIENVFSPLWKLRSITGFRGLNWKSSLDDDASPVADFQLGFREGQHQASEELQLLGTSFDSRLQWVYGLYFFHEAGGIHDFVVFGQGLLQIDGPNELETTSYATYLHADLKLTDRVGLTVGGRFSADRKAFTGGQSDLNGFFYKISGCAPYNAPASIIGGPANLTCQQLLGFPNPNNPNQIYPYGRNHLAFNEFNPTATLQYHFTDAVMGYFSYADGFQSGGWTTRLTQTLPLGTPAPSFGPETDKSYEMGLKTEWLQRRFLCNTAVFVSNFNQIQLTYNQLASPITQNAGDARIKGLEIETQSLLGAHFSLLGNLGYLDAKYTEVNTYAQATTGAYLPKTPRLKFSLSPDIHAQIYGGAEIRLGLDYTHASEMWNDVQNTWALRRPREDLFNLHSSLTSSNNKVTLTVGVENLSDRRYITTGVEDPARGIISGTYNPPREWYATLAAKY